MTHDQILAKLKDILSGPDFLVEAEQITPTASLTEDLFLNDLDVIQLTMVIEKELFKGEEIPAEVTDEWKTIGEIVDSIEEALEVA